MIHLSRRTIALALAAFLIVAALAAMSFVRTLAPAEAGAGFTDTPPWIATHAAWLADNGIAGGYPNGTFRPNNNITRGQAAFWFGNYNDSIERFGLEVTPAENSEFYVELECPIGTRAIAGGGTTNQDNMFMTDSLALTDPEAWGVRWETENDALVTPEIFVYALCAPEILGGGEGSALIPPAIDKP
jgi:hypothetical protein